MLAGWGRDLPGLESVGTSDDKFYTCTFFGWEGSSFPKRLRGSSSSGLRPVVRA